MKKKNIIVILIVSNILQSCSLAPFSNNHSARTIGKHNISIQGGGNLFERDEAFPFARIGYGARDNFDIGLVSEFQISDLLIGGWLKYAFLNDPEGFACSVEASGGGGLWGGQYFYIGPSIGYKLNWWEPYLTVRYNYAKYGNDVYIDLGWLGSHAFSTRQSLQYGLVTLGNTLWATDWLGLNINVNGAFGNIKAGYVGAGIVLVF